MDAWINELVERINSFFMRKPGVLPVVGLGLIVLNFLVQLYPGQGAWIVHSNLFLHLGLIISLVGLLLVNVYRH